MPDKYIIQRRTASGLETVAEVPALESGKIDLSWLPVVGSMGSAIIERGSNANGMYIRWADGTQVCMNHATAAIPAGNTSYVHGYTTYPAAFVSTPCTVVSPARSEITNIILYSMSSDKFMLRIYLNSAQDTAFDAAFHYIAIGRWK